MAICVQPLGSKEAHKKAKIVEIERQGKKLEALCYLKKIKALNRYYFFHLRKKHEHFN